MIDRFDSRENGETRGFDEIESILLKEELYSMSKSAALNTNNSGFDKKINLSVRVQNDIARSEKKGEKRVSYYGRDHRATSEQVLDPRTRLILFKLLSSGFLTEIDGCLSTGKEANVYYARGTGDKEYAVKIFKTSILVFRDRDRYVSGEYRFRNGYCKSNPRKMVRTWAEKEMRNLKRLNSAGIPAPVPQLLKSHVLVMDFLGEQGWCAERLKDAHLDENQLILAFKCIAVDMRRMYQICNLVHGDLSEYNLLWYRDRPVIIDVSQSVELSHPFANDFLRKDVSNVTDFFAKKGLQVLTKMELFQFVTSPHSSSNSKHRGKSDSNSNELSLDAYNSPELLIGKIEQALLDSLETIESEDRQMEQDAFAAAIQNIQNGMATSASTGDTYSINIAGGNNTKNDVGGSNLDHDTDDDIGEEEDDEVMLEAVTSKMEELLNQKDIDEAVFLQSYIPTSLNELGSNPHKEMARLQGGQREQVYSKAVSNMLAPSVISSSSDIPRNDFNKSSEDASPDNCNNTINKEIVMIDNDSGADPTSSVDSDDDDDSGSEGEEDDEDDSEDANDNEEEDGISLRKQKKNGPKKPRKDKYQRTLPSHTDPALRQQEKQARKDAKKEAKALVKEKRSKKIPKHVKKRATKVGNKGAK